MTLVSLFINWDVSPELISLGGFSIRYYGLLFALAFVCGYKVEEKLFKSEGLSQQWLDKLWIYVAVATVIGARLGHCFFYDWAYYSAHPLKLFCRFGFNRNSVLPDTKGWPATGLQSVLLPGCGTIPRR